MKTTHTEEEELTCFVAMAYQHRLTQWVYDIIADVGKKRGLSATPGARTNTFASNLREKVRRRIDEAFMVAVEASSFSWFVAFELFYAIERKHCILLYLDEDLPGPVPRRSAFDVYPELIWIPYTLPLNDQREAEELRSDLDTAIKDILKQAAAWSNNLTKSFLSASGRVLASDPIDPNLKIIGDPSTEHMEADVKEILFEPWLATKTGGQQIAITAPQGLGKTVLLTRFAHWLQGRRLNRSPHVEDMPPLGVFLTANEVPAMVDDEALWNFVKERVHRFETDAYAHSLQTCGLKHPGLLEPFCRAGLVYLLLDGLDEFGTRKRDELYLLMRALEYVAERGVNVVLTCRQVFWGQQVRGRQDYKVIQLLPFNNNQVLRFLDGIELPKAMYKQEEKPEEGVKLSSEKTLKPWVLNPLLLHFFKEIHGTDQWDETIGSRSKLYGAWAQYVASREGDRCNVEPSILLNFFGEVAIEILKERKISKSFQTLRGLMPPTETGDRLRESQLDALGIFIRVGEEQDVQFFHESLYEFFVASALKDDFEKVITVSAEQLGEPALAKVELDYLQSSTYGFLAELLDPDKDKFDPRFIGKLMDRLAKGDFSRMPWRLQRNLVEYLGMTHDDGDDRAMAKLLLALIKNADLTIRVRYNAARALERIHPQAPRPYFDYVSDWGGKDFAGPRREAREQKVRPWVMRGHGRDEPEPGKHRWFAPNDALKKMDDPNLQRYVSKQLYDILDKLITDGLSEEMPLRINCSHAWVRWFYLGHRGRLTTLIKRAKDGELEKETIENLMEWVGYQYRVSGS